MTKEDFMAVAWADFLRYAVSEQEIRDAFCRDTGRYLSSASNPMDALIDKATGKQDDDIMAFAVWVTRTQWGWDEAPASFRDDAEKWEREQSAEQPKCST